LKAAFFEINVLKSSYLNLEGLEDLLGFLFVSPIPRERAQRLWRSHLSRARDHAEGVGTP